MSLDDPTPTEYFGPHAKRWTNPDTGVSMTLSPRDYYRAVAKQQLKEEELRRLALLKSRTVSEKVSEAITAREAKVLNEPAWPNVISMDTMYDRDLQPEADLFKDRGILIIPSKDAEALATGNVVSPPASTRPQTPPPISGWNPPPHQRYDLNEFSKMVQEAEDAAAAAGAAARSAEASRDKALADAGLSIAPGGGLIKGAKIRTGDLEISADGIKPMTRATVRYLSLTEDDTFGLIRPVEQRAPGRAAGRHLKRRRITRNGVRLGLVYIIVIIGVTAVTGVIS